MKLKNIIQHKDEILDCVVYNDKFSEDKIKQIFGNKISNNDYITIKYLLNKSKNLLSDFFLDTLKEDYSGNLACSYKAMRVLCDNGFANEELNEEMVNDICNIGKYIYSKIVAYDLTTDILFPTLDIQINLEDIISKSNCTYDKFLAYKSETKKDNYPQSNYLINIWDNYEKKLTSSGSVIITPDIIVKDAFLSSVIKKEIEDYMLIDKSYIDYIGLQAVVPTGIRCRPLESEKDIPLAVVYMEVFLNNSYIEHTNHFYFTIDEVSLDYLDIFSSFALSQNKEFQSRQSMIDEINEIDDMEY